MFNQVSPIRVGSVLSDAVDAAEHVVPEVLVQKVVNGMFGKKDQGYVRPALVHLFSIPYIGGFGAPLAPDKHPSLSGDWSEQFQAGLAGVPAVYFAQYIVSILYGAGLFHLDFDLRDALITAVSKTITRPVLSAIGGFVPQTLSDNYDRLQGRFDLQSANSMLKSSKKSK